jgi:hypothetical protein
MKCRDSSGPLFLSRPVRLLFPRRLALQSLSELLIPPVVSVCGVQVSRIVLQGSNYQLNLIL